MDSLSLYRELTEAPGASGFEDGIRDALRKHLAPLADWMGTDRLGSLIARKTGLEQGPKIVLGAHMDEIGFMVTRVTEEGCLKFLPLGGWSEQVMLAQQVLIQTRKGTLVGVVGSKPPHVVSEEQRRTTVAIADMFIDIGVSGRAEAQEAGVRPGDSIVPVCPFTVMHNPNYLMAKAWDNRYGCIVLVEVMRRLQQEPHPNVLYAIGTVQEEVGLRGAITSANLVEPDVAIALDTLLAGDTPNMKPEDATARLGEGPIIGLLDRSIIAHKGLKELIFDTASDENIPLQYDFMTKGSTDAGSFHLHGGGVPSLCMGAPARYIHSAASVMHREDIERSVTLLTAVIKRLDRAALDTLLRY